MLTNPAFRGEGVPPEFPARLAVTTGLRLNCTRAI